MVLFHLFARQGWSSWTMWQYTDKGKISGINGYGSCCPRSALFGHPSPAETGTRVTARVHSGVDTSRYKGTQQQLEALVGL